MKNIVIAENFKTKDFKPSPLIKEYLSLTQKEVASFLTHQSQVTSCPACKSTKLEDAFVKYDVSYKNCLDCKSLFSFLRPKDEDIVRFYQKSEARKFWNDRLYTDTAGNRQAKIIKPRLQWVEDSTQEYLPLAKSYCDINANQPGYLKEMASLSVFQSKTFLNPLVDLKDASKNAVEVISLPWWKTQGKWDVVSLFEVLDHTSDIDALLKKANDCLPKGGLCFLTSILSSGFDIQTLWDKAEHIHPLDRLNMFSVEGLKILLDRHGFEVLEFSTPGVLDFQIVAKAYEADPSLPLPRFVKYLIGRSLQEKKAFQEFLQANLLSSYARILVCKK